MTRFLRHILLIALSLCGLTPLQAETHYQPHISVGAHAGYGLSKISFSPAVKQQWEGGYTGGLAIRYAEEKLAGIVAELNIEQRGWSELFEDSPLRYSRTLTYLSLPVMTHIYFGPPRVKCFFNLGPEFSYMIGESISANFDYNNPTSSPDWPHESRMTEQLSTRVSNRFDYGICVGFGCEFYLRPRHSTYIEVRYYYGLGNIFPATKADTFSASRPMSLAITMGYNFRLK